MADKHADSVAHFFGGTDTGAADDLNFSLETPTPTAPTAADDDALEGEIAIDVYQTENDVIVVTPIAGIDPDAIDITASDDTVTISGERQAGYQHQGEHVVTQEIYWGKFARTVSLPVPCEVDQAAAAFKHGILTVTIPKAATAKKRTIKVKSTE